MKHPDLEAQIQNKDIMVFNGKVAVETEECLNLITISNEVESLQFSTTTASCKLHTK